MIELLKLAGVVIAAGLHFRPEAASRPPIALQHDAEVVEEAGVEVVEEAGAEVVEEADTERLAEMIAALPTEPPTDPGTLWLDAKGRVRIVPSEPAGRQAVNTHRMVVEFMAWLREHDYVGWFTNYDMIDFYRWFCAERGWFEMPHADMLAALKVAPGIVFDRLRLVGPMGDADPTIRRLRRYYKKPRGSLYRVASFEEMAAEDEAKAA